ncbi:unnamed protein product [Rhizophagus irregularis]|uniref:Uncharacterized protein n=1 Tax=Rhizophagus irregularis TaxID=588596 RepID=A0A915ZUC4_9GLOM|nr:unnamed protein product [Rhizophagus irregularis]CAB5103937.1 unnamed protein product [Rhizophagus irregularis]CAB5387458.1 unnamed protein product [Rhizophagus irregularis]
MHNVIAILILLSLNLLYLLDIIGCIFIFLRAGKIYGHSNEKRMSLRIKFPFYLAVTYYLLAILGTCSINISALCTHNSCTVGSIIIDNIAEIILAINLFLGTILTLQTISELKKLRSYILLFIYQWIIIVIVIVYNLYLKLLFYKYWIFDLTYAMGGILHFILFINNEGFFFNPDSVVQQQDIHLSVENR